jgi:hypothetical protein
MAFVNTVVISKSLVLEHFSSIIYILKHWAEALPLIIWHLHVLLAIWQNIYKLEQVTHKRDGASRYSIRAVSAGYDISGGVKIIAELLDGQYVAGQR